MKKHQQFILILTICFSVLSASAQNTLCPQWELSSDGENWDVASDMVKDTEGNIYLCGNFTGTCGFQDKDLGLAGNNSAFVTKLNSDGNPDWLIQVSSTDYCYATAICMTGDVVYIAGSFNGEMEIGEQRLKSHGTKNMFLARMDANGEQNWCKALPGINSREKMFIETYPDGRLVLAATFTGNMEFDDHKYINPRHTTNIAIITFTQEGDLETTKILDGAGDVVINKMLISPQNQILITGSFEKSMHINGREIESKGRSDAFLIRLDDKLQVADYKIIGGIYEDYGQDIAFDQNGNLFWAGSFSGIVNTYEGLQLAATGKLDVFMLKLDAYGNTLWAQSFGGLANDYLNAITTGNTGDIYLSGTYRGEITIGDSTIQSIDFSSDIFLAKYNAEGEFQFIQSFGNEGQDFARRLSTDGGQSVFLSGNFAPQKDKKVNNPNDKVTKEDFFIAKWHDCSASPKVDLAGDTTICGQEEFLLVVDSSFAEYYWNGQAGGNTLVINSPGLYQLIAKDVYGCVSQDSLRIEFIEPLELEYKNSTEQTSIYKFQQDTTSIALLNNITAEIFPNPASNEISITIGNLPEHSHLQLKIYSPTGEVQWSKEIKDVSGNLFKTIDLFSFKPGTYFVLIQIGDNSYLKKIIVI